MGLDKRKPVFEVSNQVIPKPACSASKATYNIAIMQVHVSSLDNIMMVSIKPITKALIRLHGCGGWYAPLLFTNPEDMFSRDEAHLTS